MFVTQIKFAVLLYRLGPEQSVTAPCYERQPSQACGKCETYCRQRTRRKWPLNDYERCRSNCHCDEERGSTRTNGAGLRLVPIYELPKAHIGFHVVIMSDWVDVRNRDRLSNMGWIAEGRVNGGRKPRTVKFSVEIAEKLSRLVAGPFFGPVIRNG